jgi:hypothetical protein
LAVHADTEPVAPLLGPHQHVDDVGVPTDHQERRVMRLLHVQWAPLAQHPMTHGRFDVIGMGKVGVRPVGISCFRHGRLAQ